MFVEALFKAIPRFCPNVRIAVDVTPIDDQIVRHTREILLRAAAIAEEHDVAVAPCVRLELEPLQAPMVRARRRSQHSLAVGRFELGELSAVGGLNPLVLLR